MPDSPIRSHGGPIAIVGIACRFPGAENAARYWQLVRDGRHAFTRPPADRWDHDAFFSTSQRAFDKYYAPTGAYVSDVRAFAAMEFAIPPRRVEVMDPQQRLTLESAWNALQDAGYAPWVDRFAADRRPEGRALDRSRVGTWIGLSCHEYRALLGARTVAGLLAAGHFGLPADPADVAGAVNRVVPPRAFAAPGVLGNMSAAAVAQELDLGGPAFTVDAACASALVAVHDAMTYLRDGQVDVAIAGGVYLNLSPEQLVAFSRIGAISASGVCRPFDVNADGFVQGEGVGLVVLKRLEDALRDHDRIYAVLSGSAVNNDGKGDGPMSPRAEGQVGVISAAWRDAGIGADRVGYLETHGTGTPVGDRTELGALREMFAGRGAPVPIGSAKANIGHAMSAAGIAGLLKAVLGVYRKTLLPLANWTAPHPDLDPEVFSIPTEATPWHSVTPRVAGVSSFGFGGTNAHVVVEEAPRTRPTRLFPAAVPTPGGTLPGVLVVVSADTAPLLRRYLNDLAETVADGDDLDAVAHTLNLGRRRRAVRCAVVADSLPALAARFRKAADALAKDTTFRGNVDRDTVVGDAARPLPVAFLCPGQGMQRVGLLRDWLAYAPFAETLATLEADVRDITPRPLRDYLYAPDATEEALTDTAIAQPAMFAVGMGVAAVLGRWGVRPATVLGHSLGEFTAAALAGGASARDTLRFVARRGRAMSDLDGDHGAMAAVMATAEEIAPHLEATVVVANKNHPRQNVISGPTEPVDRVVARLDAAGVKAKRIPVSHAFHSPLLEAVQADVDGGLGEVTFADPTLPMASCIAAAPPVTADAVRAIFRRHATSPVDYVRGLRQAWDAGARIFVQLSAGATLSAFARGTVEDATAIVSVAADTDDGGLGLLRVLALCAAHGHPVDLTPFGAGLVPLPPVPLETQEYWGIADAPQAALVVAARGSAAPSSGAGAVAADDTPVTSAEADAPDTRARVLGLVSRVSAFPVDALRDNARLLEDLGFDSLMANELSTRLGETFPGFPGIPRALLAQSPTVADIVRHVEGASATEAVPLTDPSRPLVAWRPTLVAAPPLGLSRAAARVLDTPALTTLRALAPSDVVVRVDPADDSPRAFGIAGFVRALAREWAPRKVQVVVGTLKEAQREAHAVERDPHVVYRDGVRHVPALAPTPMVPRDLTGQTVVVSGGAGWLGRVLARALIDAGAAEVVLLGTRPEAGEALSELGAAARYVACDVTGDLGALRGLRAHGLVHAAGVLADGAVGKADGHRAWAVKVDGLGNLLSALPDLGWATAIGSYAGYFGNAYQTEYAAANAAMAGVFAARRFPGQVQIWGPWADSEMVATIPPHVRRAMREDGVWFVDRPQGARAFVDALGLPGDVVLGLDLPAVRRVLEVDEELRPDMVWLKDHALLGHPTVPMAMVLEWAGELGAVPLEDLTLYDGVVVDSPLTVRRRREGDRFRVYVGERLCWEGRVGSPDAAPVGDTPAPVSGGAPASWPVATFYASHTFHGPALQGLVSVDGVGDGFVHGRVRVGDAAAWGQPGWTFSPLAVDSAFQLCAVYALQKLGRAGFPVRVARWTPSPLPAGTTELHAWGTFTEATGDRFTGDVVLALADGTVVAVARGVEAELRAEGGPDVPEEFWNFEKFPAWQDLSLRLQMAEASGVGNPYFKMVEGIARDTVSIGGRSHVHFSGYNYLGFSGHPYVTERVFGAVRQYGTSVSASRVASGERPIHRELEAAIARAVGVEDAVVFTAGHATNVTTIGHLFGPKDLILHDELIHDSVFQGMKLSGAARRPFPHGDVAALGRMLPQLRSRFERVLIVVEGVYSMDGDLCDLPALVALKELYRCFLMVDEAHSFGVVGARGYGVAEHFGVDARRVDLWMGTLSKSLSSCGGYIGGSSVLVTLLKYTAPGFIYSAGLTPANTMAALASLELMEREPEHVAKLQHNCRFFYRRCHELGLDNGPARGESAVIPVITGNSFHALLLSDALMNRGINVQPILYPAVADNAARLRFFLSALHSEEQLAWTAATCAEELDRLRREKPV